MTSVSNFNDFKSFFASCFLTKNHTPQLQLSQAGKSHQNTKFMIFDPGGQPHVDPKEPVG
jgi:hypothetical protein